jgi:hypothetical protein
MPRLLHAAALVATVSIAVLTQSTSAHAAQPELPASTGPAMSRLMTVLDVLGIVDKDAPPESELAHVSARKPTWLSPEPPKTPLLYSSLVVMKF